MSTFDELSSNQLFSIAGVVHQTISFSSGDNAFRFDTKKSLFIPEETIVTVVNTEEGIKEYLPLMEENYDVYYTTASTCYDYSAVLSFSTNWKDKKDNNFRLVLLKKNDASYQLGRYASGLCPAYNTNQFNEQKQYGYVLTI